MDSDLHHNYQTHSFVNQQQQKPIGSGLMRYQSAPSSYFSTFLDKQLYDDFLIRPTSPEQIFVRSLANSGANTETFPGQNLVHIKQGSPVREAEQVQNKTGYLQKQGSYNSPVSPVSSQGFYQNQSVLPQPRPPPPFSDQNLGSEMDCRMVASMGMEGLPQMKFGTGASGSESGNNNSSLVRHSSSPAGFFSNINVGMENGYPVIRGMGDYGTGNRDTSYSVASRPPYPSSGRMIPIDENGSKNMRKNSTENVGFGESHGGNYVTGFSIGSWDDSSSTPAGGKGFADDDTTFSGLTEVENQGGEAGNAPRMLAHHLSLQNTSAEMDALEKILQRQDSVPCKIRAKRGCATHPRSIAERSCPERYKDSYSRPSKKLLNFWPPNLSGLVRRTRISERMRKLQDLVPNMDKQTNTAGMLDLAVDYIKDLQRQVKILSENRAKCVCTKM